MQGRYSTSLQSNPINFYVRRLEVHIEKDPRACHLTAVRSIWHSYYQSRLTIRLLQLPHPITTMSDLDPQGPAQPHLDQAYDTPGNPTDHTPEEESKASSHATTNSSTITDQRSANDISIPSTHDQSAQASSLGRGVRSTSGDRPTGDVASELDGEQMRAPGEGDVMQRQFEKGGFGEQKDFTSDLDRKKAEQAGKREEIKSQRKEEVDVGGALGGRTGPAVVEGR